MPSTSKTMPRRVGFDGVEDVVVDGRSGAKRQVADSLLDILMMWFKWVRLRSICLCFCIYWRDVASLGDFLTGFDRFYISILLKLSAKVHVIAVLCTSENLHEALNNYSSVRDDGKWE